MRPAEEGFLLLSGQLGNPERHPLTGNQLRVLADRVRQMDGFDPGRELTADDLICIGYGQEMAHRILALLSEEALLRRYLQKAARQACIPLTRVTQGYPVRLRQRLGMDAPACLWAKGDASLLDQPCVSLVGSREIRPENSRFAWEVGAQAAKQGYVLVSGNARGSDRIAQTACLRNGGRVISVVADSLADKEPVPNVLFLSEEDYDLGFSPQRALSRNRVIHGLGLLTFVAQCNLGSGGTWSGTRQNLRFDWSPVYCFGDGSDASRELEQMGAVLIREAALSDIHSLRETAQNLFDQ